MLERARFLEEYKARDNKFTGKIYSITIALTAAKTAATEELKEAMQESFRCKTLSD